jgi:predicted nucleic acid-binding protein
MPRFTLDTNVIIDAVRQPAELARLKEFLEWALPASTLSSVVALELLAGARSPEAAELIETELLALFERRQRIVAPSAASWRRAGHSLGRRAGRPTTPADQNDLLLTHSAREAGWTLITRDCGIARLPDEVTGLQVAEPFPSQPATASR